MEQALSAKEPPPVKPAPLVIGIGASAGGLEAIEQFLSHVTIYCGAAFVVIQHLDPTHKGMLPELLQHITPMKVSQASDGKMLKPGWIFWPIMIL